MEGKSFDPEYIRRLHIKALHNVEDLFAGSYRSVFKGKGIEFEDVREYQIGDDIRTIDWNVTARSQHLYVKNFREERELTVMLMVDISASSLYSHTSRLKSEMIAELAALLAFSAIQNQDKVGLLLFSNEIELYLKPQKGVRHVLRVIRELLYFKPKHQGTDLSKALAFLGDIQKRRVICFLISDFLVDPTTFDRQATLIAKKHEMITFHVYDSYEKSFPLEGLFTLRDLETQLEAVVDTSASFIKEQFRHKTEQHDLAIKRLFERSGVDYVTMNTEDSTIAVLHRFFKLREKRR